MLQINNSRSTLRNCHLKPNAVFYKILKINYLASIHFKSVPNNEMMNLIFEYVPYQKGDEKIEY